MSGRPAGRQTELGLPTNAQQCLRFEPQMEMSPAERERLRTIAKATTAAAQVEVCPPPALLLASETSRGDPGTAAVYQTWQFSCDCGAPGGAKNRAQ